MRKHFPTCITRGRQHTEVLSLPSVLTLAALAYAFLIQPFITTGQGAYLNISSVRSTKDHLNNPSPNTLTRIINTFFNITLYYLTASRRFLQPFLICPDTRPLSSAVSKKIVHLKTQTRTTDMSDSYCRKGIVRNSDSEQQINLNMKRFNLLFSFVFLFMLSQNVNAQTVTLAADSYQNITTLNQAYTCSNDASLDMVGENAAWQFGAPGVAGQDSPIVLTFSSPVTSVNIPYAAFGGSITVPSIVEIDAIGVSETLTSPCAEVSVINGNQLTNQLQSNPFGYFGTFNVSSSTPFTQVSINALQNGGMAIPNETFLNNYADLIVSTSAPCDAGTAAPQFD